MDAGHLFGTCRETYRRNPHAESENIALLPGVNMASDSSTRYVLTWTQANAPDGSVPSKMEFYPASGAFIYAQGPIGYVRRRVGGDTFPAPSGGIMKDMHVNVTNELYLRVVIQLDTYTTGSADEPSPVFSLVDDATGVEAIKLSLEWNTSGEVAYRAEYRTKDGSADFIRIAPIVRMAGDVDIKVLIPADGEASMSVETGPMTAYGVPDEGGPAGFLDTAGAKTMRLFAGKSGAMRKCYYRVRRLGIGSTIKSALP